MAHAGEEIRLCQIGFLGRRFGALQFDVILLQSLVEPLTLCDIARGGEYSLELAVAVMKGGGVVRHDGFLAVAGARGKFVVRDPAAAEYAFDAGLGPFGVGEVVFERGADEFIAGAAGERFHLLIDVGDDTGGVGGHQSVDVGFNERAGVELLVAQALIELLLLGFDLFARCVVGANQQVADDAAGVVAQSGDGYHSGKAAPVFADIGQLVDILDATRSFENERLEAGCDRCCEFETQRLGAGDYFAGIGNVGGGDLVDNLGGRVAEHALSADVE